MCEVCVGVSVCVCVSDVYKDGVALAMLLLVFRFMCVVRL